MEEGGGGEVAGGVREAVFAGEGGAQREKELDARIGQLQMELDWLEKKLARLGVGERRGMIEAEHPGLSVKR